jgi:hypothetical protein
MISVAPEQMSAAASYIANNWGDYGYRVTDVESPTYAVAAFRVAASDGSRFTVFADRWGNCDYLDTHSDDYPSPAWGQLVERMNARAVAV